MFKAFICILHHIRNEVKRNLLCKKDGLTHGFWPDNQTTYNCAQGAG
jgi:hypothetical protein